MQLPRLFAIALVWVLTFVAAPAMADDAVGSGDEGVSFAADRPGFGDATSCVPPLRVALEAGSTLEASEKGVALELPLALLRVGLLSWLEGRVLSPGISFPFGDDDTPKGTNGALGVKLAYAPHAQFEMSWVSMFGIPVVELAAGESAFEYSTTVNLGFAVAETVGLALTGATTVIQPIDSVDDTLLWEAGGALAVSGTLDDTGLYLEVTGLVDQAQEYTLGGGFGVTHMVTEKLQLDMFLNYARPQSVTTIVVGAGVATLF